VVNEDRLRDVFEMFDCDGSGYITVDEIKRMLGGDKTRKTLKSRASNNNNKMDSILIS